MNFLLIVARPLRFVEKLHTIIFKLCVHILMCDILFTGSSFFSVITFNSLGRRWRRRKYKI